MFFAKLSGKKKYVLFLNGMQREIIEKWVNKQKPGTVFSLRDIPGAISRAMGDKMLSQLVKDGKIRRVMRGVYDIPEWSELLQKHIGVDVGKVAHAIARKFGWSISPSDENTVNLMGLSTQLPASHVYVTTGPSKKYCIDGCTVTFVHRCNRELMLSNPEARNVVRAIKGFGRYYMTQKIVDQLVKRYSDSQLEEICNASRTSSEWIHAFLMRALEARRNANAK